MVRKKNAVITVNSLRHKDTRANIPTEELRGFVREDETAPGTMLYPRDSSLDPQLVWKGKDEQDRSDLAVPVVPVYIQEKIHPQAIIEDFRASIHRPDTDLQTNLFADFNGIEDDFARKVDFYSHDTASRPHWSNRMILGDSLLVMTSLAEKEGLKGQVQMIYLDPPYGIKFGSNWQVSTRKRDVKDRAEDATREPEQIRAFRDTWKLGINSYLSYLRDRLTVARELLTETGSVFVQIGDENVHLVRCVMDEVFGSENFIATIVFRTRSTSTSQYLSVLNDYVLWYSKNSDLLKYRSLFQLKELDQRFSTAELPDGKIISAFSKGELIVNLPEGTHYFSSSSLSSTTGGEGSTLPFKFNSKNYQPAISRGWRCSLNGLSNLALAGRIIEYENSIRYKYFHSDFPYIEIGNTWTDQLSEQNKSYVVQTSTQVIQRCILMTTDPGDLVLDPTCGSGTTAYVAEQWGRRWITIDTSRVALALARTRLMAAKYPYYLLADSPEGIRKEAELTGKMPPEYKTESDIKKGFVYKRVPHVTLKSIANNPDIEEGMTREQIDAAIARHADTEMLYDRPYEDRKRIRVAGPFTVESLSPHRVLAADDDLDGTISSEERDRRGDFTTMILDNLRAAGVQNTRKNERLKFDTLDSWAGTWIHASGTYTDADGQMKRVAVSIGPEHGTVGPQHVKEAAKEAVQGIGFDILIVCGFAFDPHVSEEAKRYGSLAVLPVKMNPDLTMGDELLKKTGAGNLFMVFGEPDIYIRRDDNGRVVIELKGVDVYDPTTGQVRSSSTDDIACWFIDTEYNGESFFVRHAYFTGADEPYEKLKRALRAEIDEAAWSALYSTTSRPFAKPESGKFAVKVINHYGDEVLKVFEI